MATIKLEFSAVDTINEAYSEAIRIANLLNVAVEFDFNGVTCWANSKSDIKKGVSAYHIELRKDKGFKFAVA